MNNDILDLPEKKIYPGKMAGKNYKIQLAEEKIEWAQYIMLGLALFATIKLGFIIYLNPISFVVLDITLQTIIICVYLAAAFFTSKFPTLSIGVVILFYIGIQGLYSYAYGSNYWHTGITFKIAMFSFLVFGFFYSIKVKNMRKELEAEYNNYLLNEKKIEVDSKYYLK